MFRRSKLDWSFSRRRHHHSNTSSGSLSPTVPELESPLVFHAMPIRTDSEITPKKDRKIEARASMPSIFLEERDDDEPVMPTLNRGVPSDARSVYVAHKNVEAQQATKTKSQYFEDAFNTRGSYNTPRNQVGQDSNVVVEIKMNTKIKDDESKLISDITFRLAQVYQKPESSMLVSLQQDTCLHFGNTSLPAYLTKVFALPSQIAPVTNLRNTILIQAALHDILQIEPGRGIVLYIPIPEENFATNGVTLMGEIARRTQNDEPGILRSISRSMSRRFRPSNDSSAPISGRTSLSWGAGAGTSASESATGGESKSGYTSGDEGESRNGRKPGSLRRFVSRRLSEIGSLGDVH